MENQIIISVIVPCYNLQDYIDRCIYSLKKQTINNIEFIFVNDGSTDETLTKLSIFEKQDDRVVIINKDNAGVSEARNDGIKIARGEYLLFLDGDDFINYNACEKMYALVEKNREMLLIFNYSLYENGIFKRVYNHGIPEGSYNLQEFLETVKILPISYKLYRRDIIVKNEIYFDPKIKYGEVFTFFLNYLYYCNTICVSNCSFYNYIIRNGSAIHSLNYENEINIVTTITQIDNYANRLIGLKNKYCYHKAVFQLVKVLILVKYISLGLDYAKAKKSFCRIYSHPLMINTTRFIMTKDNWLSQDKYLSILLIFSLKIAYITCTIMYKYKRLINKNKS